MKHAFQSAARGAEIPERHTDPQLTDRQLLTTLEICHRLGIERHTWRRWVVSGQAPAPVPLVPGHPRWRRGDIERFERGQRDARGWGQSRARGGREHDAIVTQPGAER